MVSITLEGVTKRWGADAAVDDVSFTVREGTLAALLGPSGCGKSTTLRIIAGLETPTAGTIRIGATDVTHLAAGQRRLAMVFQSYALFPHLTVAQNILFGLEVRNVAATERKRRLAKAAAILGLEPLLARKPAQLSGGQQQRVALGRAIVAEAPVCLMDEPLSNLDAKLRVEMRREIRHLQQTLGMTMIYVTHDQVEAMTMADQVVLMNKGRVEQDAAPADLYERPATIFAARFIGTPPMSIVPFELAARYLPGLPAAAPQGITLQSIVVGLRAEAVHLDASGDGEGLRVRALEYLGADTMVELETGGEPLLSRQPGRAALKLGDMVKLRFDVASCHWFELSSGRRIA